MKMVAIYQIVALMATVALAAPSDSSPVISEREPDVADLYTGHPEERHLYDASGLHLRSELETGLAQIGKRNGWLHCGNMPGTSLASLPT